MHASESKERFQDERNLGRSLKKLILDEYLITVRSHHYGLGEDDSTDLICQLRNRHGIKVDDILVASWLISVTITMYAEVELLAVQQQTFVNGGKEHKFPTSQLRYRNSKKPVVTPCIAGHYGRIAISAPPVCLDYLPFEGIFKVYKFGLVEIQKSHTLKYLG